MHSKCECFIAIVIFLSDLPVGLGYAYLGLKANLQCFFRIHEGVPLYKLGWRGKKGSRHKAMTSSWAERDSLLAFLVRTAHTPWEMYFVQLQVIFLPHWCCWILATLFMLHCGIVTLCVIQSSLNTGCRKAGIVVLIVVTMATSGPLALSVLCDAHSVSWFFCYIVTCK